MKPSFRHARIALAAIFLTQSIGCSSDDAAGGAAPDTDGGSGGSATGGSGGSATGGTGGGATGGSGGGATGGSGGTGGGATGGATGDGGVPEGGGSGGAGGSDAGTGGSGGDADGGGDGAAGGGGEDGGGGDAQVDAGPRLTDVEKAILGTMSPLPAVPADTTNAYADSAAAATLGQMLFFEKSYSGALKVDSDLGLIGDTGKISCASCHSGAAMDDERSPTPVSLGADYHTRNAPSAINSSFYPWVNWGGRFDAPWELPLAVSESGVIMNGNRLAIVHLVYDKYKAEYEAAFGAMDTGIADTARFPLTGKPMAAGGTPGAWEGMAADDQTIANRVFVNFGKAIEAYMRTLVSRNAPFDRWMAGDDTAVSESVIRGAQVFVGKGNCAGCHSGPHFSDGMFHNLGVPQTGDHVPATDDGRFKDLPGLLNSPFTSNSAWSDDTNTGRLNGLSLPPPDAMKGQFRTPTLRGVALSAPYMHSGQLTTLQDVIDHYDVGGHVPVSGTLSPLIQPLGLTAQEEDDLIAFLGSLTGEAVPSALTTDTSKP